MIKLMNKFKALILNPNPRKKRKFTGQGMVEFALALPILLLVVYGLLETGRLIFIYASTLNAARQAARYGSASGLSDAGVPYYRDCDGIRGAATRVGFLSIYNDINITYDGGLDDDGDPITLAGIDPAPTADTCNGVTDTDLNNGDRIKVQVSTQWSPIIAIVPSWQGFTITSSAERTLLMDVAIGVDPVGQSWVPGGVLDLTISGSPSSFNSVGQTLTFTYLLKNIGTVDLTGLSISDNPGISECTLPGTLAKGESFTCTVTYPVIQADLDAGKYSNVVFANSTQALSDTKGITINAVQSPALTLTKTPSQTVAQATGVVITYTYKLTNSGNVTLTSPYSVSDNKIDSGAIDCSGADASIAPGDFTECTAPYTITDADINYGIVTNTATATATFNSTTVTSNTATASVSTAALDLSVAASTPTVTTLNQKITYIYTLTNQSTATLTAPYSVTDSRATNISCPSLSSLAPGATTTCTGEYYVTQADLDAGTNLVNSATATSNSGAVTSNPANASVSVTQSPLLSLTISPSTALATTLGASVNFNYVIKNEGNVTLSAPFTVTDLGFSPSKSCTVASGTLAPQATVTCTLAYSIAQTDLDAGSIINLATVTTQYNGNPTTSLQATATVITYNAARITLSISSTPTSYPSAATPLLVKFKIKNTGNATVNPNYAVTANAFLGSITCGSSPLAIGQSMECTANYTTTSTDMTNGSISISATATANSGALSSSATLSISSSLQCFVYHRLTSTPAPSVTFTGSGANRKMQMSVISDGATSGTITIKNIEVRNWNYSSNSQQYISAIFFGGVQIWSGADTQRIDPLTLPSPSSASFTGNVTLTPGQTKVLLFEFNKNYTETGNEIIKITFAEAGCPVLDSSNGTQVK